jgi:hypothetical protein
MQREPESNRLQRRRVKHDEWTEPGGGTPHAAQKSIRLSSGGEQL